MSIEQILASEFVHIAFAGIGGFLLSQLTTKIANRRALFTYSVHHSRVGISTDDVIFGSVRVTYNGNPVSNLFSSTVELVNQSMRDFENITVRLHTGR